MSPAHVLEPIRTIAPNAVPVVIKGDPNSAIRDPTLTVRRRLCKLSDTNDEIRFGCSYSCASRSMRVGAFALEMESGVGHFTEHEANISVPSFA